MKSRAKVKGKRTIPVKKIIITVMLLAAIAGGGYYFYQKKQASAKASEAEVKTGTVSKQDITSELSGSGTISPKDSYTVTSMVEGEVVSADFSEGDEVTEGQVLYQIDSSSMTSKLNSAQSELTRAQKNYTDAVSDYNEAASKFSGNTVKSTMAGYIKELNIKEGDQVGANTQIAEIYDDSTMKVRIPFLSEEAQAISVGMTATLTLSDTMEEIQGSVTNVGTMDTTLTGGQIVRYVTVQVTNPGGLTTDTAVTANIGGLESAGDGTFEPARDLNLMATDLTSSVTVSKLLVAAGDHVEVGTALFTMASDDAQDILDSYQDKVDSAQSSVDNAQSSLDSTNDNYDNYTITAPISGTVVTKSVNAGENIQNGSSATSLAVIYDLSELTFQMDIDELDISNVKVGQSVEVTADAFEGQTFTGSVTNVSMEGTASNGVTYYPVTVTLTDFGGLLPGMNVTGVIILDESKDALAIPVDALQRGNKVYVKDVDGETYTDDQKGENVPDGFHSVSVETGLTSDDYVEITSGDLKEGDTVYITQSTVSSSSDQMMMGGPGGGDMGGGPGGEGGGNRGGEGGGGNRGGGGGPMG